MLKIATLIFTPNVVVSNKIKNKVKKQINNLQVQVYINNVPSACAANRDKNDATSCDFDWLSEETPHVETITTTTPGEISMGDEIEMSGKIVKY